MNESNIQFHLSPDFYLLLSDLNQLAVSANCQFIIDSGFLLGLVRSGNFNSSKSDIDISITSTSDFQNLISSGCLFGSKTWVYNSKPYKVTLDNYFNSGHPLELRLFNFDSEFWTSPSIALSKPLVAQNFPSAWRKLLSIFSSWIKSNFDFANSPLPFFVKKYKWKVPHNYFNNLIKLNEFSNLNIPKEYSSYLNFRYGDWSIRNPDWNSIRDDKALVQSQT